MGCGIVDPLSPEALAQTLPNTPPLKKKKREAAGVHQ